MSEDHDLLQIIHKNVTDVKERVVRVETKVEGLQEHGKRISDLEAWKNQQKGVKKVLMMGWSVLVAFGSGFGVWFLGHHK